MDFAVTVEGLTEEGQAVWVLAVDGDRLLVVHPDRSIGWHPISDCKFVKAVDPLLPKPVVAVPPPEPRIAKVNRMEIIGGNNA